MKADVLEGADVLTQGDLAFRAAVDVFEDRTRQPPPRGIAEVVDVDDGHREILYDWRALPWIQTYDPLGSAWLSTAAAALPIVLLLAAR